MFPNMSNTQRREEMLAVLEDIQRQRRKQICQGEHSLTSFPLY